VPIIIEAGFPSTIGSARVISVPSTIVMMSTIWCLLRTTGGSSESSLFRPEKSYVLLTPDIHEVGVKTEIVDGNL
jgi:hypothetical protein